MSEPPIRRRSGWGEMFFMGKLVRMLAGFGKSLRKVWRLIFINVEKLL